MECPDREEELSLAQRMLGEDAPEAMLARGAVEQVLTGDDLLQMRAALCDLAVRDELLNYVVDIVRRTRTHESVLVGAGPRATQALLLAARAGAAMNSRDFITPDDVKTMALPALEHRLILRPEFELEGVSVKEVVENILEDITVPI
jgi:MoxR-like ATPase